jgi:hypothetical protein
MLGDRIMRRVPTFVKLLVLGSGVAAAIILRRLRNRNRMNAAVLTDLPSVDPGVPIEGFDEAAELFVLESTDMDDAAGFEEVPTQGRQDDGELYGAHIPPAEDRELLDDDTSFEEGETWLEHMEATAAENGPEPERAVDPLDDTDPHAGHHKTDTRDIPVADRGSAGPRGLP